MSLKLRCVRNEWVGPCECYAQGLTLFSGIEFKRGKDIWYFGVPYQLNRHADVYTISAKEGERRFRLSETDLSKENLVELFKDCSCQCVDNGYQQDRFTIEEYTSVITLPFRVDDWTKVLVNLNTTWQIPGLTYNGSGVHTITFNNPLEPGYELWIIYLG
jgi:hypothetical protein